MDDQLTQQQARGILRAAATGIPPEFGFSHFSSGIDPYVSVLEDEYLDDYIRDGGSAFKLLVGVYGTGKTHFLYSVRERAWANNYAVALVPLSPESTPFHRLDYVYREIARNLTVPQTPEELLSGHERGMASVISAWYSAESERLENLSPEIRQQQISDIADQSRDLESPSFGNAVGHAFRSLAARDMDSYRDVLQYLSGDGYDARTHRPYGIIQRIDRASAFTMIRSLVQWVKSIGLSGLVILLDEGEASTALTSKQRNTILSNLREIIDECAQVRFKSAMVFYAVPDKNFLEGNGQVYQALNQRLATSFRDINPAGVVIDLETAILDPEAQLREIGGKLWEVHKIARPEDSISDHYVTDTIQNLAATIAAEGEFSAAGFRRTFVQSIIPAFRLMILEQRAVLFEDV
jgi:hypothetical protein